MADKLELVAAKAKPLHAMAFAEWLSNPDAWDREAFLSEANTFMYQVHGAHCTFDRHLLAMLADQLETYVAACHRISAEEIIVEQNNGVTSGAHPAIGIRERAAIRITALMSELGLTPRARMTGSKSLPQGKMADFLRGPKG